MVGEVVARSDVHAASHWRSLGGCAWLWLLRLGLSREVVWLFGASVFGVGVSVVWGRAGFSQGRSSAM